MLFGCAASSCDSISSNSIADLEVEINQATLSATGRILSLPTLLDFIK